MSKPKTVNECLRTRCKDCEHVCENELEINTVFNAVVHCEILRKMLREEDRHGL